jgi:hypothetical protein
VALEQLFGDCGDIAKVAVDLKCGSVDGVEEVSHGLVLKQNMGLVVGAVSVVQSRERSRDPDT